jgi:hypothetical protein
MHWSARKLRLQKLACDARPRDRHWQETATGRPRPAATVSKEVDMQQRAQSASEFQHIQPAVNAVGLLSSCNLYDIGRTHRHPCMPNVPVTVATCTCVCRLLTIVQDASHQGAMF